MQLELSVNKQIITRTDDSQVVEKSKKYLRCQFTFCEDWQDITKTAIFVSASGDVFNVILEDDACVIPWEVIQYPHFTVSVFGGDLITANRVIVSVIKSGYAEGKTPAEPTPDVYQQIIGTFATKKYVKELLGELGIVSPTTEKASITLYADRWEQSESDNMWYQEVVVANATVTKYSKVDLQPNVEQILVFYEKDVTFVTENDGGKITVYCIGQRPANDYAIQATITEVKIDGEQ